ncbi:NAD(P)-dependent alcohol dehydrogenase [Peloplasma aerotolerans]|uniref:NAD(P)-dependent alcohol dehydrogenase n=1 Tax=Peloplasma aerotolerans TaxID=3044389 RepID=A0AAW6U4S2_9MOLU|nr:NAD(P)-dependent alcohol dehydrogenase [Mariniplasma sp. M4Ah]MDI6452872.1 NAD(P)-dependent alcohol dehydrogenase [Mariniplasma sp. M4Ah]
MNAVIYYKKTKPNPLIYQSIEKPIPKDDEVLVKVYSVSLNAADYRSMSMGIIPKNKIFGSDISGVIEEVGSSCHQFKVGDEVIGDLSAMGFGGLAEYTTAKESALILKPKHLSFDDASAIPMSGVTALQALKNKGNIEINQKVLIYGSGGGVGTFAVQLAKHFMAEVSVVCGPNNIELMKTLGATHIYNYQDINFKELKGKFDLILAINGKNKLSLYRRMLSKNGTFVVVGGALSQLFKTMIFGPILSLTNKKMRVLAAKPNQEDLKYVAELCSQKLIKPIIEQVVPLKDAPQAMQYLRQGHAKGKTVIKVYEHE